VSVRLKVAANLMTSFVSSEVRPFVALEHLESGTGRLIADAELSQRPAPDTGAASVEPGDVLFGKLRPYLAKTWLADRPVFASTELLCLRPRAQVDGRWLAYLVASNPVVEWAVATSDGTKMPRTSWEKLAEYRIEIPPLACQRAIADYLDRETARIDALIEKKQRMMGLIRERALDRQELLATGRSQKVQMGPSGHDWLGPIPENWSVVRLKHYARIESGHTPSRTRPELWENCTIPWVTLNDVGYLETHEWVEETVNLISEAGIASSSARVLPAGTVILSRDATVGRCGILARPMATSQHFIDWICGQHLRPRYLWLLFRTAMQTHFASLTDGATLRTIGMPDIGELVVPFPPLDQQDLIVEQAEEVRKKAGKTMELLDKQVALLREHRQVLITAAVTGELEVPGGSA
jgi:type I restriction enzyme S subunit